MTWVRVDNGFPEHPKLEQLVGEPSKWAKAVALWLAASCYARRQQQLKPERPELHGWIPESKLQMLVPFRDAKRIAALLATAPPGFEHGLFEREGTGYRIHDFAEYGPPELRQQAPQSGTAPSIPTEDRAEDIRRKRRAAGKKGAKSRWQSANGKPSVANGKSMANATGADGKVPPPSPPNNPPNPANSVSAPVAPARDSHSKTDGTAGEQPTPFELVERGFQAFRKRVTGRTWKRGFRDYAHVEAAAEALQAEAESSGVNLEQLIEQSLRQFGAEERAKEQGYPFGWWANDPLRYLPKTPTAAAGAPPAQESDPELGPLYQRFAELKAKDWLEDDERLELGEIGERVRAIKARRAKEATG